jgi:hypothetical protein
MKLASIITLSALSLVLIATPSLSQAKEHNGKSSRHVVVNGNKNHGNSTKHHNKSHQSKRHYKNHKYSNSHQSYNHHSYKRRHNHNKFWAGLVLGATFGRYGSHYNGHAWCPTHSLYHSHNSHYNYSNNYNYNAPYKTGSFIELNDGICLRVSEYSNGAQKKRRIRDHHCDELDEWDEWEE